MDRYVGIDAHSASCTLAVLGSSGKRLRSLVVETNGRALVDAVRSIPGRVHVCLEQGTRSAWLHEILEPHVEEVIVMMASETKGPKSDARDAWTRAEQLRVGGIQTRVFRAPGGVRPEATERCRRRAISARVGEARWELGVAHRNRFDRVPEPVVPRLRQATIPAPRLQAGRPAGPFRVETAAVSRRREAGPAARDRQTGGLRSSQSFQPRPVTHQGRIFIRR
jgi:hypothetical protein